MELLMIYLLSLLCAIVLIPAARFLVRPKNKLPPGPTPLPIIGNLLQVGDKPHKSLAKLAEIYGPIMSLKLGQITTIVISSPNMAKETLQTHDQTLSDRTVPDAIVAHDHHLSLEWLPVGPEWRKLRKICNSYIFSYHKLDLNENIRRNQIRQLVADVRVSCNEGKAVKIAEVAFRTMMNTLSSCILSVDLADPSSERAREFREVFRLILHYAGKPNLSDYFPFLKNIDLQSIRRHTTIYFGKVLEMFDQMINERIELRKQNSYIPTNDVLDILLTLKDEHGNNSSESLDQQSIKHLFMLLFIAGTDTTSATLEWAMAELLRAPKTMSKARIELEKMIGKGKLVDESDIPKLPYLQAIVKETFRLHPSAPLLLPRKAREDVEMCGFMIPKGAQILVNAWAIGRDASTWNGPNSFVPERFLESDIDVRGRNFEVIPFGGGRRSCPGLPLATRMLHVMLGSLINNFDWKIENGFETEVLDMEDKFGITLEKATPLRAIPCPIT